MTGGLFEEGDLTEEETEGVEPGEENTGDNFPDTFFTEAEVVTTNDGRVYKEHSVGESQSEVSVYLHARNYLVASAPYELMTRFGSG